MHLSFRNVSTTYTGSIEVYLMDPSTAEPTAVLPTYSFAAPPDDGSMVTYDWPRSPVSNDTITFFVATNDGSGTANVTSHTPTGAATCYVRLADDGNGGFIFTFVG